jgi:hypothetical protein
VQAAKIKKPLSGEIELCATTPLPITSKRQIGFGVEALLTNQCLPSLLDAL